MKDRQDNISSFAQRNCLLDPYDNSSWCGYCQILSWRGKNCYLNTSMIDFFLKNEPQPTSTKNFVHLARTVRDGILRKYDYGITKYNLAHYGEAKPPQYNLGNIPRDLPLLHNNRGQDALSNSKDVETLLDYLKFYNVGKLHVQYVKDYAHGDFIIVTTTKDIVFNQIVTFFREKKKIKCNYCGKVVYDFNWLKHHLGDIRVDVTPGLETLILESNNADLTQSSETDNRKYNDVNSEVADNCVVDSSS
ncbi:hypothetical protein HAX54_034673 [Datura stramonium]|uniref:Uncharacterized protein n=1 Tax=Datura stramonium TaxID=4076 RepID=A0ABS8VI44_DATST|nr:hypothetical protein [Datura stramonium]